MNNVFETAIPDIELMKDVLSYILKEKFGADVYFDKAKQQQVPIVYNIACRIEGGSDKGNVAYERQMKAFVLYLTDNNMLRVANPLPGRLRKKMGNLERKGTLPVKYQLVRCATGGGRTKMCLHYWIEHVPLLVDKLTASCIEQCRYEDSIDFSYMENKNILCLGMDKGGGDVINMIRLGNRKDGNTAEHSIPISVVEKAAEDHNVLKKTIYNKAAKNYCYLFSLINSVNLL